VPYDLKRIFFYVLLAVGIYFGFDYIKEDLGSMKYPVSAFVLIAYTLAMALIQKKADQKIG